MSRDLKNDTFAYKYTLSVIAAVTAETVTYPFDITKTRLQIQGENDVSNRIKNHAKRGMITTLTGIIKEEGALNLYWGLQAAVYRHVVYSGLRMSFYEVIRDHVLKKNPDGTFPMWKASIGGLVAGGLGQFFASPTDLVKVQMQMEGRRQLEGKPHRVKTTSQAFQTLYKDGGIRGLYRGVIPNVQRAALVNMGELMTYDTTKHALIRNTPLKDNYITHTLASACSGLSATLLSTPADVIKTRVMNQPTQNGKGVLYKGSVDCLIKTVEAEGVMALYKGFFPTWARLTPWFLTFWITYEQIRRLFGVSSF